MTNPHQLREYRPVSDEHCSTMQSPLPEHHPA